MHDEWSWRKADRFCLCLSWVQLEQISLQQMFKSWNPQTSTIWLNSHIRSQGNDRIHSKEDHRKGLGYQQIEKQPIKIDNVRGIKPNKKYGKLYLKAGIRDWTFP